MKTRARSGDVPVLEYRDRGGDARNRRRALLAFVWSLLAPAVVYGVVALLESLGMDVWDVLPRWGAITVLGCIGIGTPFTSVLLGAAALRRARTRGGRWLSATAVVLGGLWCLTAAALLWWLANIAP